MYRIAKVSAVQPEAAWDSAAWDSAAVMEIASFRPESSDHHPKVRAKLLWDAAGIGVKFRVEDAFVVLKAEKLNDSVCCDSCVEFFVQPAGGNAYLNFECSGNGTILCYAIRDARRLPGGFADFTPLTAEDVREVRVSTTLPRRSDGEIAGPVTWELGLYVPFALLAAKTGAPLPRSGTVWRANLFKCADKSSHPHWASWQPVPELNFHLPQCFGEITFA